MKRHLTDAGFATVFWAYRPAEEQETTRRVTCSLGEADPKADRQLRTAPSQQPQRLTALITYAPASWAG